MSPFPLYGDFFVKWKSARLSLFGMGRGSARGPLLAVEVLAARTVDGPNPCQEGFITDIGIGLLCKRVNGGALLCSQWFALEREFGYAAVVAQPPELELALELFRRNGRAGCPSARVRRLRKLRDHRSEVLAGKPPGEKAVIKVEQLCIDRVLA